MSVVRLASSNTAPAKRACRDCRYYEPKTDTFWGYGKRHWSWSWRPPFLFMSIVPTASGHYSAICTAFGGQLASLERKYGLCGSEGKMFCAVPDQAEEGRGK